MDNVLLDKGIITPSGEISKDKINLVAGAITQKWRRTAVRTGKQTMATAQGKAVKVPTLLIRRSPFPQSKTGMERMR